MPGAEAVVITACYGGYDDLQPQVDQDIGVDWLCFTDDPDVVTPPPWRTVVVPPAHEHPRMAAKRHKLLPLVAQSDVVWIDANTQVTSPSFVREALLARRDGIAVWRHPERDCIYAEAEVSRRIRKYAGLPIAAQVDHYRAEGHPERAGLYACGALAWDLTSPQGIALGRAWLDECERWTYQDQLSLPVVARRMGLTPGVFPVRQIDRATPTWLENQWLHMHPHRSDS